MDRGRFGLVAALVVVALLAVVVAVEYEGHPLDGFVAETRFGLGALALRVGLCVAVVMQLASRRDARSNVVLAGFVTVFVASFCATSVFSVFVLASIVTLLVAAPTTRRRMAAVLWSTAVIAGGFVATSSFFVESPAASSAPDGDVAQETERWLERGNPFRARQAAALWAAAEPVHPAPPDLLVARLDWELGHRDRARRAATAIAASAASPELSKRAAEIVASWAGVPDED